MTPTDLAARYLPVHPHLWSSCEAAITQACADKDAMIAGLQAEIAGSVDGGEKLARAERDRESWLNAHNAKAAQLRAVAAALSFDPAVDRDLETCARRIYHLAALVPGHESKIAELSARVVELEMQLAAKGVQ